MEQARTARMAGKGAPTQAPLRCNRVSRSLRMHRAGEDAERRDPPSPAGSVVTSSGESAASANFSRSCSGVVANAVGPVSRQRQCARGSYRRNHRRCLRCCGTYDRIARIDQGAEVENKRLAHALEAARLLQAKRDDRRACDAPSRTHRGEQVRAKKALEGLKKQRALSIADMNEAILEVSANAMRERGGGRAAPTPQPEHKEAKHPCKTRHLYLAGTPT